MLDIHHHLFKCSSNSRHSAASYLLVLLAQEFFGFVEAEVSVSWAVFKNKSISGTLTTAALAT